MYVQGMADRITVAPQAWRAIQIHLGPMVAEFPGVVSFLSKLLADDRISILNMSTYDTDIIYVQEAALDAAIVCLQSKLSRGVHGLIEAKDAEQARCDRLSGSSQDLADDANDDTETPPTSSSLALSVVDAAQYLVVYPESLVIVRLRKDAIRKCAFGLTQLVLLSYCAPSEASESSSKDEAVSFWSYCETAEEISLIVTEVRVDRCGLDCVVRSLTLTVVCVWCPALLDGV